MTWRGEAGGVVGVRDRTGAVKGPPHSVQPLLRSPPHWGAVVRTAIHLICQDQAVSFTALHVLSPESGIPAPTQLQIENIMIGFSCFEGKK